MASDPTAIIANLLAAPQNVANNYLQGQQFAQQKQLDQQRIAANQYAMQTDMADRAAAEQQAASFQQDLAAADADGFKPDSIMRLAARYPDKIKPVLEAQKLKSEAQSAADVNFYSGVESAIVGGNTDLAKRLITERRDAMKAAGQPTDELDDAIQRVSDPKTSASVRGAMLAHIYAAVGKDKYADVYGVKDDEYGNTPQGVIYNKRTGKGPDGLSAVAVGQGDTPNVGAAGSPLSTRLNNPGAIRFDPSNKWQGQVGNANWFVQFDTPENGQRAHQKLISNQIAKGYDTPEKWAAHYAPASDGNNPTAYAATIAKGLGIGPQDKLTPAMASRMASISAAVEAGGTPSPSTTLVGTSANPKGVKSLVTSTPAQSGVDAATIDFYAQQLAGGGEMPKLGSGKQASAMRQAIAARAAQIQMDKGISGRDSNLLHADVKSAGMALTQLQKTRTNVEGFERTFMLNVDQALQLGPAGVGGSIPVFNRWIQNGRKSVKGDPAVTKFNIAINTAANEYAKLASGASGGAVTSDSARKEAMEQLNTQMTWPQLQAAVQQLKIDGHNRIVALNEQESRLRGTIAGHPVGQATAPATRPLPSVGAIVKGYRFKGGNPADRASWVKAGG